MTKKKIDQVKLWLEVWGHCIPANGPFRVSAKIYKGTFKTLQREYRWFTKPEQFTNWLRANESEIGEIVNVGVQNPK